MMIRVPSQRIRMAWSNSFFRSSTDVTNQAFLSAPVMFISLFSSATDFQNIRECDLTRGYIRNAVRESNNFSKKRAFLLCFFYIPVMDQGPESEPRSSVETQTAAGTDGKSIGIEEPTNTTTAKDEAKQKRKEKIARILTFFSLQLSLFLAALDK